MLLSHPHRCPLPRPRPHNQPLTLCRHCGLPCDIVVFSGASGPFCCVGCEAVFDLLAAQRLTGYYADRPAPGVSQKDRDRRPADRFAGLDDPEVAARLVQFEDGQTAVATFAVPAVHCGSCVWLLEQLWRFDPGITRSEVNLQRRTVRVEFRPRRDLARAGSPSSSPRLATSRSRTRKRAAGTVPRARRRPLHCSSGSPASRSAT